MNKGIQIKIHFTYNIEMKRLFFRISLLVLSIVFSTCETNLDLDMPESSILVAVNGLITVNEPLSLVIYKNLPYNKETESVQLIRNASIELFDNEIKVDSLILGEYYDPYDVIFPWSKIWVMFLRHNLNRLKNIIFE